jgi:hypothetical protein
VQIARAHPAPGREVRITITPNAIPIRRSHTLAVPFDTPHPGSIPGSPDAAAFDHATAVGRSAGPATGPVAPAGGPGLRTRVRTTPVVLSATAVAVPITVAAAGAGRESWSDLPAPRLSSGAGVRLPDRVAAAPTP